MSHMVTPNKAELVEMLAEEASEVIQAAMKMLRHGEYSSHPVTGVGNREGLSVEFGQLLGMAELLTAAGVLDPNVVGNARNERIERVRTGGAYTHYQ